MSCSLGCHSRVFDKLLRMALHWPNTKLNCYSEFLSLCKVANLEDSAEGCDYQEVKCKATDFQNAKELLFKECKKKGYGVWMTKPQEEKKFDQTALDRQKGGLI